MAAKIPVSEADKQKSYYKYYERDVLVMPPEAYEEATEEKVKPRHEALTIYDRNKMLDPDQLAYVKGHAVDGDFSPTLANYVFFPNATVEMCEWWFGWHSMDHLRYRIWDPEDHYFALNQNRDRMLNPNLTVREKTWGCTHYVDENIFSGSPHEPATNSLPDFSNPMLIEKSASFNVPYSGLDAPIALDFKSPEEYGFDTKKLYKDIGGTIICANGRSYLPGKMGVNTVMCHFFRPANGGVELFTRFWGGYQIINGKVIRVEPKDEDASSFIAMKLLQHNIKEFNNLATFLPEIYAEERDNW